MNYVGCVVEFMFFLLYWRRYAACDAPAAAPHGDDCGKWDTYALLCVLYIDVLYIYIYAGLLRDVLSGEWMSLPVAKHPDRPQVGHH